jgi:uncharacterized protein (DUF2461 family)
MATASASRCSGWPPTAVEFHRRLQADNTKAFRTASRDTYERDVADPMYLLSDEVEDLVGPLHVFRPYRDVRFSEDKSPYRTSCGAVTSTLGGACYVDMSASGLFVGSGYHHMAPDQFERLREAVDDDDSSDEVGGLALARHR